MKLSKQTFPSDSSHPYSSTVPQPDQQSALLLVDLQNDLFPGGALAVPEANSLIPLINAYIKHFSRQGWPILATRDWHPANHRSFTEQQGPWPAHGVQGSRGAQFHSDLVLPPGMMVISKGTDPKKDSTSGFDGTSLADRLEDLNVQTLYVLGLPTEHCVKHTVLDGCQRGLQVVLLTDATKGREPQQDGSPNALQEMTDAGAWLANSSDIGIPAIFH
ncbi:MAG: isochorismatase family protein [Nitrospirales bacterium]|nr:isochorismatase family protein [Nitrospirales bacterium]MDR4484827.1 isochorismatase family protein [Nitrospirales bacterium]